MKHMSVTRLPPEMRMAAMEQRCPLLHSDYRSNSGYQFCPWCGKSLVVTRTCKKCGRNFIDEKTYQAHLGDHSLYTSNPCPQCKSTSGLTYQQRRGLMYCRRCALEYKVSLAYKYKSVAKERKVKENV